jgi:hypothetical protein
MKDGPRREALVVKETLISHKMYGNRCRLMNDNASCRAQRQMHGICIQNWGKNQSSASPWAEKDARCHAQRERVEWIKRVDLDVCIMELHITQHRLVHFGIWPFSHTIFMVVKYEGNVPKWSATKHKNCYAFLKHGFWIKFNQFSFSANTSIVLITQKTIFFTHVGSLRSRFKFIF